MDPRQYMLNIYQATMMIITLVLLMIIFSLVNGCSQEMGKRIELEWVDDKPVVKYTEFKFNFFLYDRDWENFKYGGLSFDGLKGESKDVEVDLLRQRGSVK